MSSETEKITYCILKRHDGDSLPTKDYPFRNLDRELQLTFRDWVVTSIAGIIGIGIIICVIVGAVQIGRWIFS